MSADIGPYAAPLPLVHKAAAPSYAPAPIKGGYGHGPVYEEGPAIYQYEYAVDDEYSGVYMGKNENRDG